MPEGEFLNSGGNFAVLRLGKTSVSDIKNIDSTKSSSFVPFQMTVLCKQVPLETREGTTLFIWLGSDNSQGTPTSWKQGLRAMGTLISKSGGPKWNDEWELKVEIRAVFPHSIDKTDLLANASAAYFWASDIPVLGVNAYSNQTVQQIKRDVETQNVAALLYAIAAVDGRNRDAIIAAFPDLEKEFEYVPPTPVSNSSDLFSGDAQKVVDDTDQEEEFLSDDDPIYAKVNSLLSKGKLLVLFSGSPGTSKTFYASKIVNKLTNGDRNRSAFIQFHPSFSYDDFVEGYVPTGKFGGKENESLFSLRDKIFLKFCDRARNDKNRNYFLVIDELSRGDIGRIFGELLTYLEPDYREKHFTLAYSGRTISIPNNVVVFATMNPYDKSITDIDMALDRRFSKIRFDPSIEILSKILDDNGVDKELKGKLIDFFKLCQSEMTPVGLGHTFFRDVSQVDDLSALWDSELSFYFEKTLKFEPEKLKNITEQYKKLSVPAGTQNSND